MATKIQDGKTYAFVNWSTQKVIDLSGGNSQQGTAIISFQSHLDASGANQTWKVTKTDDGNYFNLSNGAAPNLFLDVTGSGPSGTPIIGWPNNGGSDNQKWQFISASSSGETPSWFIQTKSHGLYVTVPGGNDKNSTQLQATSKGGSNQAAWQRFVAYPVN